MSTEGRSSGCGEGRGWWRGPDVPVETAAESLRVASSPPPSGLSSSSSGPYLPCEFPLFTLLFLLSLQALSSSFHFLISVLCSLSQVKHSSLL